MTTATMEVLENKAVATTAESVAQEVQLAKASLPSVPVVTDENTHRAALEAIKVRKQFITEVEAKFKPVCDAAHKAWKSATDLRASFTGPANDEIKKLSTAVFRYEDDVRRKEAEAQRLIEEAARKAEAEAAAQNEVLMPWEEDQKVDIATHVTEVIRATEAKVAAEQPKLASVDGIGTKFKPWEGRITNKREFIKWCLAIESDDRINEYLSIDAPAINRLAKKLTDTMETVVPGAKAVRERTTSR